MRTISLWLKGYWYGWTHGYSKPEIYANTYVALVQSLDAMVDIGYGPGIKAVYPRSFIGPLPPGSRYEYWYETTAFSVALLVGLIGVGWYLTTKHGRFTNG